MASTDQSHLSEEQLAENPAIDLDVIAEVNRLRETLERLGLKMDHGSQVRNPYYRGPYSQPPTQRTRPLISQKRVPIR